MPAIFEHAEVAAISQQLRGALQGESQARFGVSRLLVASVMEERDTDIPSTPGGDRRSDLHPGASVSSCELFITSIMLNLFLRRGRSLLQEATPNSCLCVRSFAEVPQKLGLIKALREASGAPISDVKAALEEVKYNQGSYSYWKSFRIVLLEKTPASCLSAMLFCKLCCSSNYLFSLIIVVSLLV